MKFVIASISVVVIAASLFFTTMFFGTPWEKQEAMDDLTPYCDEYFGEDYEIDEVYYSWKAERYEIYITNSVGTEYSVFRSDFGDVVVTNLVSEEQFYLEEK